MRIQKYQSPANGIIQQDNTRVAIKPIEQTFIKRTYQPKQAYLSQDNRTKLQHEQGQKKADEAYNQQMKDKNTAIALNHLLGFSNFADIVGLGVGAGALLKKGAKYVTKQAAEKLANQKIGIVAPQFQQKGKFVSELDWSPKSWFEEAAGRKPFAYTQTDVDALASHIPEYLEIERTAKANGTWLMLPNGQRWQGDPRSWVQLMSKDGQKMMMPSENWIGGMTGRFNPYYQGRSWMNNNVDVSNSFANKKGSGLYTPMMEEGQTYSLTIPKGTKIAQKDAMGKDFVSIEHNGRTISTDEVVDDAQRKGFEATRINNIIENPHYDMGLKTQTSDFIIHNGTPRKSLLGNNGNFDLADKNIFRSFVPLGIITLGEYEK